MRYHSIKRAGMAVVLAGFLAAAGCGAQNTQSTVSGQNQPEQLPSEGTKEQETGNAPSSAGKIEQQPEQNADTAENKAPASGQSQGQPSEVGNKTEVSEGKAIENTEPLETLLAGAKTEITFSEGSAKLNGSGCYMRDGILTIERAGTYVVSGTLEDGFICVDADKESIVNLVLDGVTINHTDGAAIFVKKSLKTNIYLADGTTSSLTDGSTYVYASEEETEPNGALYSKSDLSVSGSGTLIINANYNDGIVGKDILELLGGTVKINAVGDGIVGKDHLYIENGSYELVTGGGAAKAEKNNSDTDRWNFGGWDMVESAKEDAVSSKALKSSALIQVEGGSFIIDSCDDALHSNDAVVINGGSFIINTGDDAVHAETELFINNGILQLDKCYEGLEALDITINGGDIRITAADDGINAAGTAGEEENQDSSAQGFFGGRGGRPGGFGMMEDTSASLTVNGGYLHIDAAGDGLDANGGITITGGEVYVDGPVNSGNGSLDYATTCIVDGGILVAAGSMGMSQATSGESSQAAVSYSAQQRMPAGTTVTVTDAEGKLLVSYTAAKQFQNVVISAPGMVQGMTCTLTVGDAAEELTLSDTVTYAGTASSGPGGFGGGMHRPGGGKGGR